VSQGRWKRHQIPESYTQWLFGWGVELHLDTVNRSQVFAGLDLMGKNIAENDIVYDLTALTQFWCSPGTCSTLRESTTNQLCSARIPFMEFQHAGPGDSPMTSFMFYSYQGDAVMLFNFETVIQLQFTVEHYTVAHNQAIASVFSKPILAEEADNLTAQILASTFAGIKDKADEKIQDPVSPSAESSSRQNLIRTFTSLRRT
jgi:hypothetical protein